MTTLMHGGDAGVLHIGYCLTDDHDAARSYAQGDMISHVDLDLDGLVVLEVEGYDADDNRAPGDHDENFDADVIIFDDADRDGQPHRTWRLVSQRAVDGAVVVCHEPAEAEAIKEWREEFPGEDADEIDIELWLDQAPPRADWRGWARNNETIPRLVRWIRDGREATAEEVSEIEVR